MNKSSEAMKQTKNITAGNQHSISSFISSVKERIANFFKPEEVEVTFKEDAQGNIVSYTYTEVPQKHVAWTRHQPIL